MVQRCREEGGRRLPHHLGGPACGHLQSSDKRARPQRETTGLGKHSSTVDGNEGGCWLGMQEPEGALQGEKHGGVTCPWGAWKNTLTQFKTGS